jgi:hypothetical protein
MGGVTRDSLIMIYLLSPGTRVGVLPLCFCPGGEVEAILSSGGLMERTRRILAGANDR